MRSLALVLLTVASVVAAACGNGAGTNGSDVVVRTPTAATSSTPAGTTDATAPAPSGTTGPAATATAPAGQTTAPGDVTFVPCGNILVPLDKKHRLPADCVPTGLVSVPPAYSYGETRRLRGDAADALMRLIDAAARDGVFIYATSAYRDYDQQVITYNWHVSTYGEEYANRVSARPGHSEHQLGTTVDVVSASAGYVLENFPGTREAAWVEAHASGFGFIVSYPEGKESVTGYAYEPWHIRFVGKDVAAAVVASGLTLGQYLQRLP